MRMRDYEDYENMSPNHSKTKHSFRKSLDKLAKPRIQTTAQDGRNKEIGKILKKCKRLMFTGSRFKVQMSNF